MARSHWAAKLNTSLQDEPKWLGNPFGFYIVCTLASAIWTSALGLAADTLFPNTAHAPFLGTAQLTINSFNTLLLTPAILFFFFWIPKKELSSAKKLEERKLIKGKKLSTTLHKAIYDPWLLVAAVPTALVVFLLMVFWAWPLESANVEALSPFLLSPWLWILFGLWFMPVITLFAASVFRLWRTVEIHKRFFAEKGNLVELQIVGADKLGGFGELGNYYIGVGWFAAVFMLWFMFEAILLPNLMGHDPDPVFMVVVAAVYIFLLQRFLLRSSLAIHKAMKTKKDEILGKQHARLNALNKRIMSGGVAVSDKIAKLITTRESLTDQINYLEKNLPEWPYRLPRVLASWTFPPQLAAVAFLADIFDVADAVRKIMP